MSRIREEDFTREQLHESLVVLFSCLDFDELVWALDEDHEPDYSMETEELVDVVADIYTDKLYPAILGAFEEHIPYMSGHDAEGNEFFEHNFMYHAGVPIYYCMEESTMDGDTFFDVYTEVYLLSDGSLPIVTSTHVKYGNFELEHKRQVGCITEDVKFGFDEGTLFVMLDKLTNDFDKEEG